jgi:hypothetical protein
MVQSPPASWRALLSYHFRRPVVHSDERKMPHPEDRRTRELRVFPLVLWFSEWDNLFA